MVIELVLESSAGRGRLRKRRKELEWLPRIGKIADPLVTRCFCSHLLGLSFLRIMEPRGTGKALKIFDFSRLELVEFASLGDWFLVPFSSCFS